MPSLWGQPPDAEHVSHLDLVLPAAGLVHDALCQLAHNVSKLGVQSELSDGCPCHTHEHRALDLEQAILPVLGHVPPGPRKHPLLHHAGRVRCRRARGLGVGLPGPSSPQNQRLAARLLGLHNEGDGRQHAHPEMPLKLLQRLVLQCVAPTALPLDVKRRLVPAQRVDEGRHARVGKDRQHKHQRLARDALGPRLPERLRARTNVPEALVHPGTDAISIVKEHGEASGGCTHECEAKCTSQTAATECLDVQCFEAPQIEVWKTQCAGPRNNHKEVAHHDHNSGCFECLPQRLLVIDLGPLQRKPRPEEECIVNTQGKINEEDEGIIVIDVEALGKLLEDANCGLATEVGCDHADDGCENTEDVADEQPQQEARHGHCNEGMLHHGLQFRVH
mmetsp:Transcript_106391/g.300864  ORF Transcript_106391/g.300864 Transcript_106391/m.300864 type:complete len:391 (-) Transcript_106391:716-1888(-)